MIVVQTKKQKPKNAMSRNILLVLCGAFLIFSIGMYITYSLTVAVDVPFGDHWRWIKGLLIHLVNGKINFWEYVTGEFHPFAHSHIPTLLFIWINYQLFDLNYTLECYIGLVCHLLFFLWLITAYYKSAVRDIDKRYVSVIVILFAAILLHPRNVLAWTLVQFEYLYLLLAFAYFIAFDRHIRKELPLQKFAVIIPVMFFLGDVMGIVAILASLLFLFLFKLRANCKTLIAIVLILLICSWTAIILIPKAYSHTNITRPDAIAYFIQHPTEVLDFIMRVCSQSLINYRVLQRIFVDHTNQALYTIGFTVFLFIISALYFFWSFRKELFTTNIPVLLMLFGIISAIGIMFSRLPQFGPDVAFGNRFIRLFQVGLVGALWINATILYEYASKHSHAKIKIVTLCLLPFIVIMYCYLSRGSFILKYRESPLKHKIKTVQALKKYSDDYDFDIERFDRRCAKQFCKPSVIFLKKRNLSFFREERQP